MTGVTDDVRRTCSSEGMRAGSGESSGTGIGTAVSEVALQRSSARWVWAGGGDGGVDHGCPIQGSRCF